MEKRRKVYDDGSTMVESVETKKKNNLKIDLEDEGKSQNNKKTLFVKDILSAFAGYLPPRANFGDNKPNECQICGKETSSSLRTICFDCMVKHGKKLYEEAKKAIEVNQDSFEF